jgi:hypothetical protein
MEFWSAVDFIVDADSYCIQCSAEYKEHCLGGNTCATGYAEAGCATCAANFYTVSAACHACPAPEVVAVFYMLIAALCISMVFWTFRLADMQSKNEVLTLFFM